MRKSVPVVLCVALALGGILLPAPASSAGGMRVPSTGSITSNGLFLACRNGSSAQTTEYYDQANTLRTWDCGEGKRPHKGVDISGSSTPGITPVYAAAPGEVWTSERGNGFGWRVVLRHGQVGGNGRFTYTIYGHMGNCSTGESYIAPGIVAGGRVATGDLLGYQGDDAYPSSCAARSHVHWEVRASDTDVSNVFLALPASPDFYTGVQLTADSPAPVTSVTAGDGSDTAPPIDPTDPLPSGIPFPWPSGKPLPTWPAIQPGAWPWPTALPTFSPAPGSPPPTSGADPTPTASPPAWWSPPPGGWTPPSWSPPPNWQQWWTYTPPPTPPEGDGEAQEGDGETQAAQTEESSQPEPEPSPPPETTS